MAVYGAFEPGSFNAWFLNLFANVFVSPGVARGMQVTAPGGMQVSLTLDGTANDGVCYLPNGGFIRIDSVQSFAVPNNSSGGTRTDAVVAFLDPTGVSQPSFSLTYVTNWASGFTPGNLNQLVLALVSVPNGAVAISTGNITNNANAAKLVGTAGGGNSMVATDGIGIGVQDSTSPATLTLALTGLTTGIGRAVAIQTTDVSAVGHQFTFATDNGLILPQTSFAQRGYITNAATITMNGTPLRNESASTYRILMQVVNNSTYDLHLQAGNGSLIFDMLSASPSIDKSGNFVGPVGGGVPTTRNGAALSVPIYTGTTTPVSPPTGAVWIKA